MNGTPIWGRGIRALQFSLVAAAALVPVAGGGAGEPEPPAHLKELRLVTHKFIDPFSDPGPAMDLGKRVRFSAVERAGDGEYTAFGAGIAHGWVGENRVRAKRSGGGYGLVSYPRLRRGDLVPVYGYVYEVTHITPDSDKAVAGGELKLRWVPAEKVPAGVAPGPEALLIPLGGANSALAAAKSIDAVPAGDPKAAPVLAARLELRREFLVQSAQGGYVKSRDYTATIKEKDVLLLGPQNQEVGYKVRKVVPRDEKTKVIGWVELDPEPIPMADLDRAKVQYVVPAEVPEKK